MAREIDWSKPVEGDDRTWAEQRRDAPAGFGMTVGQRLDQNDIEHGTASKKASQTRSERMGELRSIIADSQNELSRLEQEQADEDNANRAFTGDMATGNVIADNTVVNGETPEGAPQGEVNYSGKEWNHSTLQAEIDKRNEERAEAGLEPLARTGSKSELVERLQQDDREIAASDSE